MAKRKITVIQLDVPEDHIAFNLQDLVEAVDGVMCERLEMMQDTSIDGIDPLVLLSILQEIGATK